MAEKLRNQLQRFSNSLSLVLYDRELEIKKPITFYYDTDVIYRTIVGLEGVYNEEKEIEKLLVRALLSCGLLGTFCILRPHAFELNSILQLKKQYPRKEDQKAYMDMAKEYLCQNNIFETFSKLQSIVNENDKARYRDQDAKIEAFLNILANCAGDIFAHIEPLNGKWWERMHRYFYQMKIFCLGKLGPEMQDIHAKNKETLYEINLILRENRHDNQTINAFQDALALTMLSRMIREKDEGESDEIIRFYTETSYLKSTIIKNTKIREMLSYKNIDFDNPKLKARASLILRDSRYFIMRAWFKELSQRNDSTDVETLKELKTLSQKITELLTLPEHHIMEAMKNIIYSGKGLNDLIEDFENFSIMQKIWTRGNIPPALKNIHFFKQWGSVFDFAENPNTFQLNFQHIVQVCEELEAKVSRMKLWAENFGNIMKEAVIFHNQLKKKKFESIDLMRDLGLVRWGYNLNHREKAELIKTLGSIIKKGNSDITVEISYIATRMNEAKHSPSQCLVVCGVLWAIGCYQEIVMLVNECNRNNRGRNFPPSLLVIKYASEMKFGKNLVNFEKKKHKLKQLLAILEKQRDKQRIGILLGVGYVVYHVWKQEIIKEGIKFWNTERASAELTKLAKLCFSLGEEAIKKLPNGELAWAFALNHCAYVGIMTGVEPEKTENYFYELVRLETLSNLWNARFADTIAYYYLSDAERNWHNASLTERQNLDLSEQFEMTQENLHKARNLQYIEDIDLAEHFNRLNSLKKVYTKFKQENR